MIFNLNNDKDRADYKDYCNGLYMIRDIYVISGDTALTGFDWGFHDENSDRKSVV